ncbi:serine/threonine protein kinase [Candidatus Uabimicrobium amorphum]|uniref:Protein kinase n=1 Tax=Uabimicrobium amorphum TaxID=2596890 RepID=A0A5S9IU03_UABAM|nr:serine/threonine-protein kinase [Candidatus Uabimicrobium amorphum]BBM87914.1 protein kinase [Candidatus Uabimicrobium amorphum]
MHKKIGELIVEEGWITPEERDEVLAMQQEKRRSGAANVETLLGKLLEEQGLVTPTVIAEILDRQNNSFRDKFERLITEEETFDFAGYKVEQFIARGGMGMIYRVSSPKFRGPLVMKIMDLSTISEKVKKRFQREISIILRLSHPNIVQVFDYGELDGIDYLVMEYLEGETFDQIINNSSLHYSFWCQKFLVLLSAIQKIHENGIVHRDLKPQNIMYSKYKQFVVLDFGLGKIKDEITSLTSIEILGTPSYMSPEQTVPTTKQTFQVDIWSLGVILYQLLTQRLPFDEQTKRDLLHAIRNQEIVSPQVYNPEIPNALVEVCKKALNKNPENRYAQVKDMADALKKALAQKTSKPQKSLRYQKMMIYGLGCLTLAVMITFYQQVIVKRQKQQTPNVQNTNQPSANRQTTNDENTDGAKPSLHKQGSDTVNLEQGAHEKWRVRLEKMQREYPKNSRKVKDWQTFLRNFAQDNPYTDEDDKMRQTARKRVEVLRKNIHKKKWHIRLGKMEREYPKNSSKVKDWQIFLRDFVQDNPYTDRDDKMRQTARTKIRTLQTYKKKIQQIMAQFSQVEKTPYVLINERIEAWQSFYDKIQRDIPYFFQDNHIRQKIKARILELNNEKLRNSQMLVILIVQNKEILAKCTAILQKEGFRTDVLNIKTSKNECIYYSRLESTPTLQQVQHICNIVAKFAHRKLHIKKIKIADKKEIRLKISD